MAHKPYQSLRRAPLRRNRSLLPTALLVAISLSPVALFVDFERSGGTAPDAQVAGIAASPAPEPLKTALSLDPALINPKPTLSQGALAFKQSSPIQPGFRSPVQREASIAPPEPVTIPAPPLEIAQAVAPIPMMAPLPVPRPADRRTPKPSASSQVASAPTAMTPRVLAAPAVASADNRNFIEKLFGIRPASPPDAALSYAALDRGTGSIAPTARFGPGTNLASPGTAVYDIVAQTVHMPNGEKLEAHSGLGNMMDNPRHVNVRMKGSTPPGTYILTEREALFHGVRAIRLNPVGGSPAIYGRDGILAHTYLLGPRGDSNGCVSFKDYDKFLQAYLRGEVKRLIVTAGRGQDLLPPMAGNRTAQPRRFARAI
ncbi:tlde1 domain-containing protein [Microvirga sp. CF3062]|uniref:tlde1 domain-containing protein n=1 Tax=Microvirga sp. CF3062 TaxID=3110182 RepID=UPI002E7786CC|nr:tlde1 domain-containing protein [Microvirga sp. CF3062]MEE1657836.1 tlde1 domain-containing protein [Microvirga sp. CF3062]